MPDAAPCSSQSPINQPQTTAPPRFCWPMRLFLGFLVFDMVFHSFAALTPTDVWAKELGITRFPERLPTPEERSKLAEKISEDNPDPVGDSVWGSVDALWDYFKPWPSART